MSSPFRVLIADFLHEHEVESAVFGPLAHIELAKAWDEQELLERLPSTDAVLLYHDIPWLGEKSLSHAGKCLAVVRAGVGTNNVDLKAAGERGILVCNVPDYGTEEVADHSMLLLLAVARQLRNGDEAIRSGTWNFQTVIDTPRLRGKTLGLVGCGRIGTAMALRAKAFGLDVAFYDPNVPPGYDKALGIRRVDTLEGLLAQSLIVSLHCYLDEGSRYLINARTLAIMPKGSILVNTARGGVVNQEDLLAALETGHLLGAGLDVCEREPLDDDRLRNHPRVVLSPHSAFYSREGFVELRRKAAEEVLRLLEGKAPRCPVNQNLLVNPRAKGFTTRLGS